MASHGKCPITKDWEPYSSDFRRDPFPTYKAFRDECPIGWVEAHGGFWAVSRYEDIFNVARNPEQFCSGHGIAIPPLEYEGRALPMESDAPEHTEYRQILAAELTPAAVGEREAMLRISARRLLAEFSGDGQVDVCERFAKQLPTTVICQLLGITADDVNLRDLQEWTEQIVYERSAPEAARLASRHIVEFFRDLIPERRRNLGEDFISKLLQARVDGKPLSEQEVMDFCWFLLIAGLDNTAFTIRNTLLQISKSDTLREQLLAEPSRIPDAVEEVLRLYSPVWGIARTATEEARVAGQLISPGERVLLLYASADRDEREFDDPDTFVLGRTPNRHMAFGMGKHRCLGSHLARLEIRVAVEEVLHWLPDYRVTGEVEWNTMGPLPIRFSPQAVIVEER